jgi:hypothetical protein
MHQFSASFQMPGIYTADGKPSGVDANWIPYSMAEIKTQLGLPVDAAAQESSFNPEEILAVYRRGWQARTDSLVKYLQETREGGQG